MTGIQKKILGLIFILGCSSAPSKEDHVLHHILIQNLHFRRPEWIGADPTAQSDEPGFHSQTLPNATLDCLPLHQLFQGISLVGVRNCLATLDHKKRLSFEKKLALDRSGAESGENQEDDHEKKIDFSYLLKRDVMPYLDLENSEEAPACIREVLPKIPVPREIFFQSNEEGHMQCYNARIPLVQEEVLGIYAAMHDWREDIVFPLKFMPTTDEETLVLLSTWAITPFWDDQPERLVSKVVPQELCRRCLGGRQLFKDLDSLPSLWPHQEE